MRLYKLPENFEVKLDDKFFLKNLGVVVGVRHPCQWYLPEWNLLLESVDCGDVARIFLQVRKYAQFLKRLEGLKPAFQKVDNCKLSVFLDNFKFDGLEKPTDVPSYGNGFLCLENYVIPIANWRLVATEEEWLTVVDKVLDELLEKLDEVEVELYAKYSL